MITKFLSAVVLLMVFLGSASGVRADLVVSISSPTDLDHLAIGASAEFEVSLSLSGSPPVGFLTTSIQYDSSNFDNLMIQAGPAVPDGAGFDSSGSSSGVVTAFYDDSPMSTSPITTDGLFYSFTLTRIAAPATSLSFIAFAAMDDSGYVIAVSAAPDTIAVAVAPMNAVPEPSSGTLAVSGLMVIACSRRCCRRSR